MSYELVYSKAAVKAIQNLPPAIRKRLRMKLEWFATQVHPVEFAKPRTKPADAQYRLRVGSYRLLFDMDGQRIVVLYVQHRREVYRR